MNTTTILAAIAALLTGLTAGTFINTDDTTNVAMQTSMQNRNQGDYMPLAADYVSTRPEVANLPSEALSTSERDGLLLMREEEKLARDVYQTLYDTWDLQIFANIAQSEQTHTEAMRTLLDKYNIADPVTDDTIGVFVNKDFANLYTSLIETGLTSEVAALRVGATIEDLDINDLEKLLAETDNQDITLVYKNLARGSRNHLRAFTNQLSARGETYEPSYISQEAFNSIVDSSQETGNSTQNSGRDNRGWGRNR